VKAHFPRVGECQDVEVGVVGGRGSILIDAREGGWERGGTGKGDNI